jgi:peptide/nickel transport system substrate-binding protein
MKNEHLFSRTLAVACLVVVALAAAPALMHAQAGQITVVVGAEPPTLSPRDGCSYSANFVTDNIYERLTRRLPDGTVVGWLAESYQQIDNLTWRFKLRQGIKFSNGENFDADAVVTVLTYYMDPAKASRCYGDYNTVKGVQKVDAYTVDIKTAALDPTIPSRLLKLYIIAPKWLTTTPDAEAAVTAVGTGPYTVSEWAKGRSITLKANASYWGTPKPSIGTVRVVARGESAVRAAMVQAGEADIAINISKDQAAPLPRSVVEHTTEAVFMRLNTQHPVLKDVRVRKAIAMAVDNGAIMKALYPGVSSPLNGHIIRPSALGYNPKLVPYPVDAREAQRLVREAGAVGANLKLIVRTDQIANAMEMAEAIQGMINATGLKVTLVPMEAGPWRDLLFANRPGQERTDLNIISASNIQFDSSRVINFYFGLGQFSHADSPDFQAKLDKAAAMSGSARIAAYQALWQEIYDNYWVLPNFGIDYIHGLGKGVQWTPRDDGFVYFNTVTK